MIGAGRPLAIGVSLLVAGAAVACDVALFRKGPPPVGPSEHPQPSARDAPRPAPSVGATPWPMVSAASASSSPSPASGFRIVGYVGDTGAPITPEQLAMVTHVNYAFVTPNADGTFSDIANAWKLHGLVEAAEASDVEVMISVGGWGWDDRFEALAADDGTRATFVAGLRAFVDEYALDGVDIDWEYPDPGASSAAYTALMRELRDVLPAGEKLLTTAVVAAGDTGLGIDDEVFEVVDFVNVMAYDGPGPNHSSYAYAKGALAYWASRGLAAEKTVLGVPFYSRPSYVPYRELVQTDPAAAAADEWERYGVVERYNGMATMERKTRLAMERASGIMIWTVAQDTTGETSLLATIHGTAQGAGADR